MVLDFGEYLYYPGGRVGSELGNLLLQGAWSRVLHLDHSFSLVTLSGGSMGCRKCSCDGKWEGWEHTGGWDTVLNYLSRAKFYTYPKIKAEKQPVLAHTYSTIFKSFSSASNRVILVPELGLVSEK